MKLKDITLSIFDGKHGDCRDRDGSGVYFISVKDLKDYEIDYSNARQIEESDFEQNYKRTNLEVGDTIYANTGDTIGKSMYVVEHPLVSKTSFQKSVAVIKPNQDLVNSKYLYYLLKYKTPGLRKAATGSGQKNLLLSTMREFEVSIHEKKVQEQIVEVLSAIDDKIRVNSKINDNLEQQMKLLYDYWFTQFDFPSEDGTPYRSSGKKMVLNSTLKKEIPQSWNVVPMIKVFSFESGYPFSSDSYSSTGKYKLLTIKNVQNTGINLDVDNYINDLPSNMPNYCLLQPYDILMSLTGNVGRIGIMYSDSCLLNQRVALAKPFKKDWNSFVYFLLKSDLVHKQYETIANGSSQQNLSPIEAGNVTIAFNEEIVDKFSAICDRHLSTIVSNLAENQELSNLRDWLLPMLMNGQVTIED